MKSRELTKQVLVATLIASMMLTNVSCAPAAPEPESVPAPEIVRTTQEFTTDVGDKYRYTNMGAETYYQETLATVVPVEGKVLSLTGHQIYADRDNPNALSIISGIGKVYLTDIDINNLYEEKTGKRINVVKDAKGLEDIVAVYDITSGVFDGGKELPTGMPTGVNVIFNDRSYDIPNIVDETENGIAIAINSLCKATGMDSEDQTYNRSGDKFFGIPTSFIDSISVLIDVPSSVSGYELIFDEVSKDVYYGCFSDMSRNSYYIHEDFLKKMLGWEVKYFAEQKILVIRTDSNAIYGNALFAGVSDTEAKAITLAEYEVIKNKGTATETTEKFKAEEVIKEEAKKEEESKPQAPIVTPPKTPDVVTGIPDGGNVLPDGTIDNSVVSRPEVPKADDGAPKAEENPNASSSTPESKPSTGGIRTSGTVPGATQKDKYLGLKDGETMTPAGKFIPRSEAYDMCYYNEGGTIYKILRGVGKEVGSPVGGEFDSSGNGETWG